MVRQALADAQPRGPEGVGTREADIGAIDAIQRWNTGGGPKSTEKQRRTARRIWHRIKAEIPDRVIAEVPVRQYVGRRSVRSASLR